MDNLFATFGNDDIFRIHYFDKSYTNKDIPKEILIDIAYNENISLPYDEKIDISENALNDILRLILKKYCYGYSLDYKIYMLRIILSELSIKQLFDMILYHLHEKNLIQII